MGICADFRTGFESAFAFQTAKTSTDIKYQADNCIKGLSYIPIVGMIAWAIILCNSSSDLDLKDTRDRAFLSRAIVSITGFGIFLPIVDLVATILLHTK